MELAILPVLFLVPLVVALIATVFWMLIDYLTKEPSEGNDKLVWTLAIIFTHGVGALIYLLVRRPERIRQYGS